MHTLAGGAPESVFPSFFFFCGWPACYRQKGHKYAGGSWGIFELLREFRRIPYDRAREGILFRASRGGTAGSAVKAQILEAGNALGIGKG
jgi:hypothetical protein